MKSEDDFGNFDEPEAEVKDNGSDNNDWGNFDEPEAEQKDETIAKSDDLGDFDQKTSTS